jgi:hypothetical protein
MKPVTVGDDLLIPTAPIPGTSLHVGVAMSRVTVVLESHVRVAGVLQRRSRSVVRCRVELQSGWPAGQPLADWPVAALWQSNGFVDVPAPGLGLPARFELSGLQEFRFFFPMVRVRWVLSTDDGSALLASDYVIVSAEIRPYSG